MTYIVHIVIGHIYFIEAESTFKSMVFKCLHHIDSKEIVSSLQKNSSVLANFSKIQSQADQAVKMEVALNLLEDLLSLYMCVRELSCVKDKQQLHKMKSDKIKSKSLRTTLKQKSVDLDQGH